MLVPIALPSKSRESPTRNWAVAGLIVTAVIGFRGGVEVLPPPQLHRITTSRSAAQVSRENLLRKNNFSVALSESFPAKNCGLSAGIHLSIPPSYLAPERECLSC